MSKNSIQNYFKILGVTKEASYEEIASFWKLARESHPDLNPNDQGAESKFKVINEADELLYNLEKRRVMKIFL